MRKLTLSTIRRSLGFTMLELMIVLGVSALIAVYATAELNNKSEESLAEAAAAYLELVAQAGGQYALINYDALNNGDDVPGFANDLRPTLPELAATGRFNGGFPTGAGAVPGRLSLQVDILRQNCPGPNCLLTALACTTTPVTLGGNFTRFDLASTMMTRQGGAGGQSLQGAGGVIRGPLLNVANPMGNVEGIVCGSSVVDTARFAQFVRIRDLRDPDLRGPLTVAGATRLQSTLAVAGNTTVAGTLSTTGNQSVGTCAQTIATTGQAGFGCAAATDLPAGYTGGVRTPDVVASGRILASDNPSGFTGANTNYAYVGVSGGVAEVRTSGRAAADRLTPQGQYTPGAACIADDEGSIARRSGAAGLVVCQGGSWFVMANANIGVDGEACAPNGSVASASSGEQLLCVGGFFRGMSGIIRSGLPGTACALPGTSAIDTTNNNETLICRANPGGGAFKYMRLRDVTQHMSFVSAVEATNGTTVARPTCMPTAGSMPVSIIQLIPKTVTSSDGGIDMRVTETATLWTVIMRNGAGKPLAGTPMAIAQVFCYYP